MGEKEDLLKIPVRERTPIQHLRLSKLFGGVREYLLSMGEFKDEFEQIVAQKLKQIEKDKLDRKFKNMGRK